MSAPEPAPAPPTLKNEELLRRYRKELGDATTRAQSAPAELNQSFDNLVSYLTQDMTLDLQRVRVIFIWLSRQNFMKADQGTTQSKVTPAGFLNLIALKKTSLADLFYELCKKASIHCKIIDGYCKKLPHPKTPTAETVNSQWLAVHVAGQWGLIHPTLAFSGFTFKQSKYRKIETRGQRVNQRNDLVSGDCDENFFLPDPDDFIYPCRPLEDAWQLLGRDAWTWEQFIEEPDSTPYINNPLTVGFYSAYIPSLTVLDREKDYPPPSPPKTGKKDAIAHVDFGKTDSKANCMTPSTEHLLASYETLFDDLFEGLHTDVERVRALLMWLSCNDEYRYITEQYLETADNQTPFGALKLATKNRLEVEQFFTVLCRQAKIPCVLVHGKEKRADLYELGESDTVSETVWQAVYVDGSWRLIHVRNFLYSIQHEQWRETDVTGNETTKTRTEWIRKITEFFFLTDPEQFIHICFPNDDKWQLLGQPVTRQQFFEEPWIHPPYFESPAPFRPDTTVCLQAKDGLCRLPLDGKLSAEKSAPYNLYYEENKENTWPEHLGEVESSVSILSFHNEGLSRVLVFKLPVTGKYTLEWLTDKNETSLKLLAVSHGDPKKNTQFPGSAEIGFGMQERAQAEGLEEVSKREGGIKALPGDRVNIRLLSSTKGPRQRLGTAEQGKNTHFEAKFLNTKNKKVGGKKNVKIVEENGSLVLETKVPFGEDRSPLALQVDLCDSDNNTKPILKYLVTSDINEAAFAADRTPEKQAEHEMTLATEDSDVGRVEIALRESRRFHLDEKCGDKQLTAQERSMELHKKACQEAVEKEDVQALKLAISEVHRSQIAFYVHRSVWFESAKQSLRMLKRRAPSQRLKKNQVPGSKAQARAAQEE